MAGMWDTEEGSGVALGQRVTHRDSALQPQGVCRAVNLRGSQRAATQAEEEGARLHLALGKLSADVPSVASTMPLG